MNVRQLRDAVANMDPTTEVVVETPNGHRLFGVVAAPYDDLTGAVVIETNERED